MLPFCMVNNSFSDPSNPVFKRNIMMLKNFEAESRSCSKFVQDGCRAHRGGSSSSKVAELPLMEEESV
ncbi:hypothetical protein RIF29_29423 [Crotalaria pallida]|uniref:Uncharacterized protein n=1 Tax=Crotalaria pallida TaxID=3830 RepID=A0AAN9EFH7_CROPI